ncbi:transglycosylase SLT domain-containing protein [Actinokineospora auranticolor]|uniref:Membrane-bound lytic murein transglycosylase B n=1 Tax=Actinokineospora auranticolor TaxID=155976 RepID=A0A2S6GYL3_9PSEU|nr:lytic murein transglycosylase [Actinokineospora auranticolor]PPK70325.1 membrane-bound lytic murein transglycosylase B [Actinokineospora auranticolor]
MAASPTPQPTTLSLALHPAPEPPRRRGLRVVLRLAVVALLFASAAAAVWVIAASKDAKPPPPRPRFTVPALDVARDTPVPPAVGVPAGVDQRDWARRLSEQTDIPARTLIAYLNAEADMRERAPDCGLTWNTLAGVGRVESHHGRYGGTAIAEDGKLSEPIIGVPLDGSPGVQAIPDTDKGTLDGDAQWDRAVGSMQFLPSTWKRYALRAGDDGATPNPQDVDDAALTAAHYLCASGGNLATGEGWWKAILTYNESLKYGRDVYSGAAAYATKAAGLN